MGSDSQCLAGHAKYDLELPKGGHMQVGTCRKIPAMLKRDLKHA
jgi:hypothetical protein